MVPITLSQIKFALGDRGSDFRMLRPSVAEEAAKEAAQEAYNDAYKEAYEKALAELTE